MMHLTKPSSPNSSGVKAMDGYDWPVFMPGEVWLCGSGPGDPGLISLHTLNALQQADCVVYDALIDKRILQWTRTECQHIYAGKRGGKASTRQVDITRRLIDMAKQSHRVLRLKGGDPFVFGRGADEVHELAKHHIRIRIIPGITAATAALALSGVPLTSRDINQSVIFITGHDKNGQTPGSLDWRAIANSAPVIVIYMGLKTIGTIARRLIAAGRDKNEAVTVVSRASTPNHAVIETTLSEAEATIHSAPNISAPSIICIGRHVDFAEYLIL